ncbi:hypothetical protein TDB9533_00055 [Thalassocella blandensis]|nr:hypothetical protein TDB9533_00055 [Thalassocella blandensis]
MQIRSLLILAFLMALPSVSRAVAFETATRLYQENQYQRAYDAFKEMAELGNAEAMYKIGLIQVQDIPSDEDLVEGYAWLLFAIDSGYEDNSMADSVKFLLNPSQLKQANIKYKQLKQTNNAEAIQEKYFPITFNSNTGGKSYIPAQLLRSQAARDKTNEPVGYVDVAYTISTDGTTRDQKVLYASQRKLEGAALDLVKQYVYQPASYEGRLMHEFYRKTRIRFSNSTAELRKMEDLRYEELLAQANTGSSVHLYQLAEHLSLSGAKEESSQWLIKAAQYGSTRAKFELGRDLLYGTQCLFDYEKSVYWLTKAASEGLADAQLLLGMEYLLGTRLPKNISEGLILLHFAANTDNDAAKLKYAQVLAVHPSDALRKTHSPSRYVSQVNKHQYRDLITYYETRSMVEESQDDLKNAVKWQKKAIKEAEKYGLPTQNLVVSLDNLQNQNIIVSD